MQIQNRYEKQLLVADYSSVLYIISYIKKYQEANMNIWTFVTDFRQQEWWGRLGGLIFRLLNIWLFESRETAPLGKTKKLKTFKKKRIGVEEQAHENICFVNNPSFKGAQWLDHGKTYVMSRYVKYEC